jgi:single-strand DNA-binding protein
MSAFRNKVQLIGNLGDKPDIRIAENGKKTARFSIATHDVSKNEAGEKVTDTQWHNLVAWGRIAELAESMLEKGSEVMIEGKLVHHNFVGRDGVKKYYTEIHVNELLLMGERKREMVK